MRFAKWNSDNHFEYFVEFKNLSENNWIKDSGVKVRSTTLIKRYVTTGIKHFHSGYYPSIGCLCGYITEGKPEDIVDKLNSVLVTMLFNPLEKINPINNHNYIYQIRFDKFSLKNIFFEFNR